MRAGLIVGIVCYFTWGFLPLLFHQFASDAALTVVADRTIWSLLLVGGVLLAWGRFGEVRAAFADRRTLVALLISAGLLAVNWLCFVYAVSSGHALEGSFGYFINPLFNVAIGMLLLGERQNRWQVLAIAIAVAAIAVQSAGIGRIPFLALVIAGTFGFYGFIRKTARVGSASGLFVETLLLTPFAIAFLVYSFISTGSVGIHADPYYMSLLVLTGPATAVPLLLFTFAVQRLRLTTIGMLQYLAPSMQFLLAIFVFREAINPIQLLSFALIWLSLIIYSADSFARARAQQK